jgi:DNA-binding response OmpR family regulator
MTRQNHISLRSVIPGENEPTGCCYVRQAVCILVVEDEPVIRFIVAEGLAEAGFDVCEAEDGDRAAVLIEGFGTPFTLLITDIHMPGTLNGLAVARLMRARHPSIPVIYTTGRPDVLATAGRLRDNEALLAKPFTPSDLLTLATRLLARSEDTSH